jgi:hypothetical protein
MCIQCSTVFSECFLRDFSYLICACVQLPLIQIITRVGKIRNAYEILVGTTKGSDYLVDLGADERIMYCRFVWSAIVSAVNEHHDQ